VKSSFSRPRILWLSTRFPYPPIGGDVLLTYKHLEGLSKWADVYLFSLDEFKTANNRKIQKLAESTNLKQIDVVLLEKRRSAINAFPYSLLSGYPAQATYYYSFQALKKLKKLIKIISPDIVIFQTIRFWPYIKELGIHNISYAFLVDAISHNYSVALKHISWKTKIIYSYEIPRILRLEKKIVELCKGTIFVAKRDIKWLADNGINTENCYVVPNGVDLNRFSYKPPNLESRVITFVGNMRTVANNDAAIFFASEIFPLLKSQNNNISFKVVGANPSKQLIKLSRKIGFEVTGKVDDIRIHLWNSRITVAPMRIGAGLQNKVLEAAALGVPQIITPLAYQGFDHLKNGEHLLVRDEESFYDGVYVFMSRSNDKKLTKMSENSRKIVERYYSWNISWNKLKAVIKQ